MSLKEYQAKRNFRSTAEPAGKVARGNHHQFVVQKHAATRLHYDFRLEMEGVLKSWAVPKGFPPTKGDRRLAVEVEDHPLDYGGFEGTIPPGNYGAGTVMLWDLGTYEVVGGVDPLQALKSGKLHLSLHGKKLVGEWTLVRMRPRNDSDKPQWLILKSGDDVPAISSKLDDQSVLSKRSMDEIAHANDRQWQSNGVAKNSGVSANVRKAAPAASRAKASAAQPRSQRALLAGRAPSAKNASALRTSNSHSAAAALDSVDMRKLPRAVPSFKEPMKALLVENLPRGDQWIYELKFDGIRAVALKNRAQVELISRTGKDLTAKYPRVAEALKSLATPSAMLDGEVVALDSEGRSSFQLLQSYEMDGGKKPPLLYYVFDALNLDGRDLTSLPLLQRKALAEAAVAALTDATDVIRLSPGMDAASEDIMREMKARGLEGLIAKKKNSPYEFGRRSGAWVKYKWTNEQEFVIGGYTPPQGTRSRFGAILVGYYEGKKLMFAGKVGTGFDEKTLDLLYGKFQKITQAACPFANLPEKLGGRHQGMTASAMRKCTWLKPKLVCQVRFAEWTRDHHLRQPAFLGLREDRRPEEVVREVPQQTKSGG